MGVSLVDHTHHKFCYFSHLKCTIREHLIRSRGSTTTVICFQSFAAPPPPTPVLLSWPVWGLHLSSPALGACVHLAAPGASKNAPPAAPPAASLQRLRAPPPGPAHEVVIPFSQPPPPPALASPGLLSVSGLACPGRFTPVGLPPRQAGLGMSPGESPRKAWHACGPGLLRLQVPSQPVLLPAPTRWRPEEPAGGPQS